MFLGWSSCVYPLEANDFASVPDYAGEPIPARELPDDPVLLLIQKGRPDCLLRGRDVIVRAAGGTVPVRVVFRPSVAKWNLVGTLVRVVRNKYRYHGSRVYHISPEAVRGLKIERAIRTLHNPQARAGWDRAASMIRLAESLKRDGYRDDRPIVVMLCRTGGTADSVRQGHHRISACLELDIPRMAMEFAAAGVAPWQRWSVAKRVVCACVAGLVALLLAGAACWLFLPGDLHHQELDTSRLPEIVGINEMPRAREPEGLSGITAAGGDMYYAACDDGSGIWTLHVGIDRTTGSVTNCTIVGNVPMDGDNEGIAWDARRRTVLLANEKNTSIFEVDPRTGGRTSMLPLPVSLDRVRRNRGMEAIGMSPDGEFLWVVNEEALKGDGGLSTKERGTIVRLLRFRRRGESGWAQDGQWTYQTDSIDGGSTRRMRSGVSDICPLENGVVLMLERELSRKGVAPVYRCRIYAIRPTADAPFDMSRPLGKKLLFGADTGLANYEGICLGPRLENGDRSLLLISDGDGEDAERLYALRLIEPRHSPVVGKGSEE